MSTERVLCPVCQAEGEVSTVVDHGTSRTCMYFQPYHDEAGVQHHHDRNKNCTEYTCSRGHEWTKIWYKKCPACEYQARPDEIKITKGSPL